MNQVKSKDSNSRQGSELLEAVGGLEAAQAIVNDAPDGAELVLRPFFNIYFKQLGSFNAVAWCPMLKRWYNPQKYNLMEDWCFKLSDLRAAIDEYESNQRVADLKQRVEKAKASLSTFTYKPEVCIEEEPLSRFQSKHCSPRLLEHMQFDVPVVPVIKPDCAECADKEHVLTVLRTLQCSNLSTYAKRVHRQQTHILIYEVIIGALIVTCIGLVLWGLK